MPPKRETDNRLEKTNEKVSLSESNLKETIARQEEELKANERKYRSLFTYSMDAILLTTPDGGILDANLAACDMFGCSLEEIKRLGRQGLVDETDLRLDIALNERTVKGRSRAEITMIRANGEKFPVEITSKIFIDADGRQKTSMIIRDITNRRQSEDALREKEETLQAFFDATHESMVLIDTEGTIVLSNKTGAQRLGKTMAQFVATCLYDHFPPDVAQFRKKHYDQVVATGEPVNFIDSRAGRMYEQHCYPAFDKAGKVSGVAIFAQDITDRRRAELEREKALEALRESEKKYRLVVENANDIVWTFDLNSMKYSFVSPSVKRLLGFSVEEATKISLRDSFPPDTFKYVERSFAALIAGRIKDNILIIEAEHYHCNGALVWLEISARPMRDAKGAVTGFSGVSRDISARKQAEIEREATLEALNRSQGTLSSIIEFLPDATVVIDREGKVIAWNRAMEDLTGVRADDMLGKGNYEYGLVLYEKRLPMLIDAALHPELESQVGQNHIEYCENALYTEVMIHNRQGKDLYLTATASVLRDAAGAVVGAVESLRNEMERKHLEKRLQQSEKLTALSRISAGVAHEILNPLGIISLELQLLQAEDDIPSTVHEELDICMKQVERIVAIADDLKQLSRVSSDVMIPDNVNDVIAQVLRMFRSQLKLEGVAIEVCYGEGLPKTLLNRQKIEQVLVNLITNALAAMEGKKEQVLTIETGIHERDDGRYIRTVIADTGRGIKGHDLSRIFEPFYTTKQLDRGMGMGLSISHGIIQQHGGRIWAENNERGGASFFIEIPVRVAEKESE